MRYMKRKCVIFHFILVLKSVSKLLYRKESVCNTEILNYNKFQQNKSVLTTFISWQLFILNYEILRAHDKLYISAFPFLNIVSISIDE